MLGVKECWEIDVYYSKLDYSKQISINEIINNTETNIKKTQSLKISSLIKVVSKYYILKTLK